MSDRLSIAGHRLNVGQHGDEGLTRLLIRSLRIRCQHRKKVVSAARRRVNLKARSRCELGSDPTAEITRNMIAGLRLTLLWPVKPSGGFHEPEHVSCGVALEAAADLGVGFVVGAARVR
jgi:hypothetical protein